MKRLGIVFALVTGVMALLTGTYLFFKLAQGTPRKDLGFVTTFLMILTWPVQLAGIGVAFMVWMDREIGRRSSVTSAALWLHGAAVVLWVTFLLLLSSP